MDRLHGSYGYYHYSGNASPNKKSVWAMKDIMRWIIIIAQIFAYILAIILIVQLWKSLMGGTWAVEDVILAFVALNITLTFTILGYILGLNNKIAKVDSKIEGHISWHRGQESRRTKHTQAMLR